MESDVPNIHGKPKSSKLPAGSGEKIENVPINWARKAHTSDRIPIPNTKNVIVNDDYTRVTLDDQTTYAQNDFVFVTPTAACPPRHRDDIDYAPPSSFRIARIMSFEGKEDNLDVLVNWFYRPEVVAKRSTNSRELLATFETGKCKLAEFRGKCTVTNKLELRNLGRFCDKPSQFWVSQLFDPVTRRVYDVLPVPSLKSLNASSLEAIESVVASVVVHPDQTKKLCEVQRKRRPPQAEQARSESKVTSENLALKNEWPFRFLDVATLTVSPVIGLPRSRSDTAESFVSLDKHIDVPDWPGKPLVYYTMAAHNPASGESQKLRLLEAENGQDIWNVDPSLPWVQQMPKGYIGRGGDATATDVSKPLTNIAEFLDACQNNYASKLGVEPYNLNFIDACCKVFTTNGGDENKALVEVSRFTRRSIGEPDLTAAEKEAFETAMNPFQKQSWHDVFKAVKTKPIADLSQYFWSQRPASAVTSAENQFWETDPKPEAINVQCAVCLTEETSEWKCLPGYVPIPATDPDMRKALCSRCARLWFRYQINWLPSYSVEKLDAEGQNVESELVEDSKALKAEEERRKKRRVVAQEKQEALVRKRQEAKQAKAEAKATGKSTKAPARKKVKLETPEPDPDTTHEEPHPEEPQQSSPDQDAKTPVEEGRDEEIQEPQDDSEVDAGVQVSRRRHNTTQLTLNSIDDDFLNTLSEDAPPELGLVSQNCVVCGQLDISMPQQTCASCGLKVHTACYGPGRYDGSGPWICDCCINSRNGLGMDSFYQCAVCPPEQPNYARWLNGEAVGASDVLKGTADKTWCHLRCAVWIKDITFLNPSDLDGIDTGDQGLYQGKDQCAVCVRLAEEQTESPLDTNSTSNKGNVSKWSKSGVCVHCDICNEAFHVSCAAKQCYTFGFLKSVTPLKPVIRCSRHGNSHSDLKPMSYVNMATDLTVLQEYVRAHKKSQRDGTITAIERARNAANSELARVTQSTVPDTTLVVSKTSLLVARGKIRCIECGSRAASYCLSTERGHTCPLCFHGLHWSGKKSVDPNAVSVQEGLLKMVDTIFKGGSKPN